MKIYFSCHFMGFSVDISSTEIRYLHLPFILCWYWMICEAALQLDRNLNSCHGICRFKLQKQHSCAWSHCTILLHLLLLHDIWSLAISRHKNFIPTGWWRRKYLWNISHFGGKSLQLIWTFIIKRRFILSISRLHSIDGWPHSAIETVIFLSQWMGCMGYNVSVHIVQLQQRDEIPFSPYVVKNKSQSQSYRVNSPYRLTTQWDCDCDFYRNKWITWHTM